MKSPELDDGEIAATQEQLGELFRLTESQLQQYAPDNTSQCSILGSHNGIPVIPYRQSLERKITIAAEKLLAVTPEAKTQLGIDKFIEISFILPSYKAFDDLDSVEEEYSPPTCLYHIEKVDAERLYMIDQDDDGEHWITDISDAYTKNPAGISITPEQNLLNWLVNGPQLQHQLGLDQISDTDCQALQAVVGHLESLVQ